MDMKLIYKDDISKISMEALYCIGGYITYEVLISTGGFSGICNFCISGDTLQEYIARINYMLKTLSGHIEILDCESDAYLKVFFKDTKNVYMQGQVGGSNQDNILKFSFKSDQTMLYRLKENLLYY